MTLGVPISPRAKRRVSEEADGDAGRHPSVPAPVSAPPSPASSAPAAGDGEGPARPMDDVAERFAAHLAGRDAMQLIVEVAHDMRSPLGSILFLAERLRSMQSGPLTPVQERQIGLIYSAAFGLSALAGDVIELARGGAGLVHQQPIPFSVADLMQARRRDRAADRRRKGTGGAAGAAAGGRADRAASGPQPRAAEPHHQRPEVHGAGRDRGGGHPALAHRARVLGDRTPGAASRSR